MSQLPAVSCICLTYGRPELLEEAIQCFLLQDYAGPKELIVLNDYDGQTLELDHPEVRVINLPKRLRSIGEKRNLAVSLAAHDLLFVWDDDDIYLPQRLTFSVARLEARYGFFKPDQAWIWEDSELKGLMKALLNAGSCWTRRLFDAVGGYPAHNKGSDRLFEQRLKTRFPAAIKSYEIRPEDVYYIYRWNGTGSYHVSGFGGDEHGENVGYREVEAYVQHRAILGDVLRGHIFLNPHWKNDYQRLVDDFLRSTPEVAGDRPADQPKEMFR